MTVTPTPVQITSTRTKSLGVAYVLWFFFGIFGVHQFYLGKTGRGVGYLLTAAWGLIAWFIDMFTLPTQVKRINTLGF
jgi:TM2 domain-containing membrane protein YozV